MVATVEIYGLVDPRDGRVRYIGKANDTRKRLAGHLRDARRRSTPVYAWVRKLGALGLKPEARVLERVEGDGWKDAERRLIAEHRALGPLLNVADGGDEPACPIEVRRANAARLNADDELKAFKALMRGAGQSERYMRQRGRVDVADRLVESMAKLRGLSREGKVRAGQMWMERHPHG